MSFKDTKSRRLLAALPLLLAALLLVASASARAETITGQFSYLDVGYNNQQPIPGSTVEIFRSMPGSGGWGKYGEVSTNLEGRIAVEIPGETSGVVYLLRVHASNDYVTVLGPSGAFFGDMPQQTVSYPDEVLDFTYRFDDLDAAKFFNIASTVWYAGEYVKQVYKVLPKTEVQMELSSGNTFYSPGSDTLHIDLDYGFDDGGILHEYGHFVHDQLGSLTLQPSSHDFCTVSDPEVAFMEGFADYFERAVLRIMPVPEAFSRDLEYTFRGQCGPGPSDSIKLFTAATLWDLVDPLCDYLYNEYHDFVRDQDSKILALLDYDLDYSRLLRAPTIWDFHDAWLNGRNNDPDLDRIYAHHGLIPDFNLSEWVNMEVPTTMVVGRTYPIWIRMRNTGSTIWEVGKQQLGSQSPENNLTWGLNRVDMDTRVEGSPDVYPGQERGFYFNVTAPATPGSYTFQWQMVQSGTEWFGAATPMAVIHVTTEIERAQFVSQSVPSSMKAGRTYPVSVTMYNNGDTTWNPGTHFLGSQNPQDNLNWGLNRIALPASVPPGGQVTFSFNVKAPSQVGNYGFQWRMVKQGVGWFGDATPMAVVNVVTEIESAQYVSQSVPSSMTAGRTYAVSVTMHNNGETTWSPSTHFLGSQNPQDNLNWGLNRVALPASVPPGGQVTFNFNVKAPSQSGSYNFQWRMLQNGSGWFGDYTPTVMVNVTAEIESAQYVSQSVPNSMTADRTYAVSVTMRNIGDTTWNPGTHFLGSQNPQDNLNWGLSRVALPASVPPGGQVTFNFNVKAPSQSGSYNFQWRMLQNGIGWFGDYTSTVAVNVTRIESARYLSQSVPSSMTTDGTYPVSVTLYNSGDTTWKPGTHFLGSQNPQDNLNWGLNRVPLPVSVPPGGQVTFYFNVKAPSWAGSYGFQWRMLQDGVGWFGEYTPNVSVSVKAPSTCNAMDCANECIASGCRGGSCSTGRCVCLRCL